jgi:hypothetical protein
LRYPWKTGLPWISGNDVRSGISTEPKKTEHTDFWLVVDCTQSPKNGPALIVKKQRRKEAEPCQGQTKKYF